MLNLWLPVLLRDIAQIGLDFRAPTDATPRAARELAVSHGDQTLFHLPVVSCFECRQRSSSYGELV